MTHDTKHALDGDGASSWFAAGSFGAGGLAQLRRLRYELIGAVLFAIVLPVALRWGGVTDDWLVPQQLNTMVASGLAILLGLLALRQIGTLPGVRENYYLVPIMMLSFAVVLLVMLFARVEYNRYLFPSSLALSVLWIFLTRTMVKRQRLPRFSVVPGGASNTIFSVPGAKWIALDEPQLPAEPVAGVVVDLRDALAPKWERFIADCALRGTRVFHVKQIAESMTGRVEIEHLSENTLGSLNPDALYLKVKQLVDWSTALLVLVLISPVLILVGLIIRLESPGPALFRQTRIGFRGQPFIVYKFRTMVQPAQQAGDARDAAMTKANDPRITALGRFLRRTRIDELPQLINIVRGEMSWIGPRPEAATLSEWYQKELPFYSYRHIVRPGISGWAQINQGHVVQVDDVLEKLHYDFYYIKNFSPWLDVLILLRTVGTMISGFGAR